MRATSPTTLLLTCWGLTGAAAAVTLSNPAHFDLVALFMQREDLDIAAFTWMGGAWILLGLLVYLVADMAARHCLPPARPQFAPRMALDCAARLTFWVNLCLLGVTLLWIASTAVKMGGILQLGAMAYVDSLTARDMLLGNKLFNGMRLFYAALPATGCLAAGLLATGALGRGAWWMCLSVLALNAFALLVLPLVMSQRLLLLQFLLSAYLVACLVRGRVMGAGWIVLAAALFLAAWVGREAVTNPLIDRSALDIGLQKLAFYFVNDLWNGFAPLQRDIEHTFGAVSLEGVMFFTFTEGLVAEVMGPRLMALDDVQGGGEFPLFTAAYVDFGPVLGAVFIGVCAFVIRLVYHRGQRGLGWAAIYAQFGAALLFSSHGIYFTHQNFLFSLIIIALISRAARPRRVQARRVQAARSPAMPVLFISRRFGPNEGGQNA